MGVEEEISRTAKSIHQEPLLKADRKRVYEALTDAQQFNKVMQIIAAKEPSISPEKSPTQISREAGCVSPHSNLHNRRCTAGEI